MCDCLWQMNPNYGSQDCTTTGACMLQKQVKLVKNGASVNVGFLPDIYRIFQKYGLSNYIETFANCGEFPSKWSWKNRISEQVSKFERNESLKRIRNDILLRDYLTIINSD